jgi:protein-tyrosine phosphatase
MATVRDTNKRDPKRERKVSVSDFIYKHSPIKKGTIVVKNEDTPLTAYNKIMSRLYLGNHVASKDPKFFESKNIKAVLNCSKDIPNTFAKKDVEYMRIPIDDSLREVDFNKAHLFMPAAVEFIHKHIVLQGDNALVHCWAGRQRSACMVAAYLMAKKNLTPKQACKLILEKRPEAFHFGMSLNFEKSLERYYQDLQKCK